MSETWTSPRTTKIIGLYVDMNRELKDKLKEAVVWLKKTQYYYEDESGDCDELCNECGSQYSLTVAHDPDCALNNFIIDNQGE